MLSYALATKTAPTVPSLLVGRTWHFVLSQRFWTYRASRQAHAATISVFFKGGTGRWAIMPAKEPQQTRNASPFLPVSSLRIWLHCGRRHVWPPFPLLCKLAQRPIVYCSPPHFRLISTFAKEDGNRLCMGNMHSSQITQLDQVVTLLLTQCKTWAKVFSNLGQRNWLHLGISTTGTSQ